MNQPVFIAPKGKRCSGCPVRACTVCCSLDPDQLAGLELVTTFRELARRETLVFEDDVDMPVANVLTGQLKVSRSLPDGRTQVLRLLRPGDFFPGGSVIAGVTVTALTKSTLCIVPRRTLDRIAANIPSLLEALRDELEVEIADAQDHLMALGRMTAVEKVADFFAREYAHALKLGECAAPFTLHLSRAEMADYLGLTTETVSRVITRLKNAGLIRFEPGRVARLHITDPGALMAMAGSRVPARTQGMQAVS